VEKIVQVPVEKEVIVEKIVEKEVIVEKIVEVPVEKEIIVEKIVEVLVEKPNEESSIVENEELQSEDIEFLNQPPTDPEQTFIAAKRLTYSK